MVDKEKLLAEAVRQFKKTRKKSKNNLACDIAKEVDYPEGKKCFEKCFPIFN